MVKGKSGGVPTHLRPGTRPTATATSSGALFFVKGTLLVGGLAGCPTKCRMYVELVMRGSMDETFGKTKDAQQEKFELS